MTFANYNLSSSIGLRALRAVYMVDVIVAS